ncbi:Mechanosensitive ion channel-domain-containing protein [Tribonema minus]|uniref:Mechanosensitive ion channel-domain-containing protein n=1 Tax=Tribonema minus TaxID=303371 RepID=A0A835ZID6_9STRA|nr:Mechanosensitive ion channel-domain-containing protein [Tribonema minus]
MACDSKVRSRSVVDLCVPDEEAKMRHAHQEHRLLRNYLTMSSTAKPRQFCCLDGGTICSLCSSMGCCAFLYSTHVAESSQNAGHFGAGVPVDVVTHMGCELTTAMVVLAHAAVELPVTAPLQNPWWVVAMHSTSKLKACRHRRLIGQCSQLPIDVDVHVRGLNENFIEKCNFSSTCNLQRGTSHGSHCAYEVPSTSGLDRGVSFVRALINPRDLALFVGFYLVYKKALRVIYGLQAKAMRAMASRSGSGAPAAVKPFEQSWLGFLEPRLRSLTRVMAGLYVANGALGGLANLGYRLRPGTQDFVSTVVATLYAGYFIDELKRQQRSRDAFCCLSCAPQFYLPVIWPELQNDMRKAFIYNRTTSVLTWTLVALGLLQVISAFLHIPLASTMAFGGAGGIAFGFAAKGIFENFFGGLTLLLSEPFVPGDMVHFEYGGEVMEGRVERVGWYQTRLRGRDTRPTYIPNNVFLSNLVTNMDRISECTCMHMQPLHTRGAEGSGVLLLSNFIVQFLLSDFVTTMDRISECGADAGERAAHPQVKLSVQRPNEWQHDVRRNTLCAPQVRAQAAPALPRHVAGGADADRHQGSTQRAAQGGPAVAVPRAPGRLRGMNGRTLRVQCLTAVLICASLGARALLQGAADQHRAVLCDEELRRVPLPAAGCPPSAAALECSVPEAMAEPQGDAGTGPRCTSRLARRFCRTRLWRVCSEQLAPALSRDLSLCRGPCGACTVRVATDSTRDSALRRHVTPRRRRRRQARFGCRRGSALGICNCRQGSHSQHNTATLLASAHTHWRMRHLLSDCRGSDAHHRARPLVS